MTQFLTRSMPWSLPHGQRLHQTSFSNGGPATLSSHTSCKLGTWYCSCSCFCAWCYENRVHLNDWPARTLVLGCSSEQNNPIQCNTQSAQHATATGIPSFLCTTQKLVLIRGTSEPASATLSIVTSQFILQTHFFFNFLPFCKILAYHFWLLRVSFSKG